MPWERGSAHTGEEIRSLLPQPDVRFQAMEKKTRALAPISVGVKADRHDFVAIAGVAATFSSVPYDGGGKQLSFSGVRRAPRSFMKDAWVSAVCCRSVSRCQKQRWVGLRRPMVAVGRFGLMAPGPLGLKRSPLLYALLGS
jgi:hypothetical protein